MNRKLWIIISASLLAIILLVAILLFKPGSKQVNDQLLQTGKADTVLKFKLSFREDSGKQDNQNLTLACKNGKAAVGSKGRNFDMAKHANQACRSINLLPPGDNTCGSISTKSKVYGLAEVRGVIKGKPFKAQYENNSTKECIKQRAIWLRAERLWTLQEKGDPQAAQKSEKAKKQQREKSSALKKEFQKMQEAHRKSLATQKRNNQKYLSPDVEITGDPAKPR